MTAPDFRQLELAWWEHVEASCPYPINSRLRYHWIREHSVFEYRGRRYRRRAEPLRAIDGHRSRGTRVIFEDDEHGGAPSIVGVIAGGRSLIQVAGNLSG
jgi:hypothetical protein